MTQPMMIFPVPAPVRQDSFDLHQTLIDSLERAQITLQPGDVLAISSKYAAIAEGRTVRLDDIVVTPEAAALAERYAMNPTIAQLVMQEADHIFGGIPGFLLTHKDGIISPNAGIDRSNIPSGNAVLFPRDPYATAEQIRQMLLTRLGVQVGVILTDSWLMPGRLGTTGVALATAGFRPLADERGKADLFGNAMQVTVRGLSDQICAAAQLVMGERDEATPFALVRGADVQMSDTPITVADVAIDWRMCIYVESLTEGLLQTVQMSHGG
ncbi:MAG: coenzyme F420-0:L-glutamate ligase [Anaerolineae bacterium]|nr:coenzyme F420-0:L-glutamate ligase [Anaerolineae bacterium]